MSDLLLSATPWLYLIVAGVVYGAADRAARARRDEWGGDRGDFWSGVVRISVPLLGAPLLLSGWIETLSEPTWRAGRHLHFDRTGGWGLQGAWAYLAALALPLAVWGVVLIVQLARRPREPESARWLAGIASEPGSRRWVLGAALPCLAVLLAAWPHIGGGPHAFPAAVWSFQAVVLFSLVGVARSRGTAEARTSDAEEIGRVGNVDPPLAPWPEALLRRRIDVDTIGHWPPDPFDEPPVPDRRSDLAMRLHEWGVRGIEPHLVEAAEALFDPVGTEGRERLVQAPDHAGQVEVVAAAAGLLAERFHERTLIIVPRGADRLERTLARRLDPDLLQRVEPGRLLREEAFVWVVDAESLSTWFLPEQMREPDRLGSLGLVVWWDLHAYSGVLGANLWAVSRRIHRLLERWGRPDVRTLALIRRMGHDGAEARRFVQSLLPHSFHATTEWIERRFARRLHLHLLSGAPDDEDRGGTPAGRRHLLFRAARASVDERWATHLEHLPSVPGSDLHALLQEDAGGRRFAARLLDDPASAAVSLLEVEDDDVLSLPERVARRGRCSPSHLPHHAGIAMPRNPYARHLLRGLGSSGENRSFASYRRLVCAEGTPEILRKHLLLALEELQDTSLGLSRAFRRETELIRDTLDSLADEGQLVREEVRFLNEKGKLERDHLFRSRRAGSDDRLPLTTVGLRPIEVVDPNARDQGGVRMQVDPERLAIEAYPGRVFLASGRRYRVRDWISLDEAVTKGWIACEEEDRHVRTWRLRSPSLHDLAPDGDDFMTSSTGAGSVSRLVVACRYEERLRGSLRLDDSGAAYPLGEPRRSELRMPIRTAFETRALVLRFQEPDDPAALPSLAQALRHVLPAHVGIPEDALEVVPLVDVPVRGRPLCGLAIADLYPGGIGIVDALRSDEDLILHLLGQARKWLESCRCRRDDGCPECLRAPAAEAVVVDAPIRRSAAAGLLRDILA